MLIIIVSGGRYLSGIPPIHLETPQKAQRKEQTKKLKEKRGGEGRGWSENNLKYNKKKNPDSLDFRYIICSLDAQKVPPPSDLSSFHFLKERDAERSQRVQSVHTGGPEGGGQGGEPGGGGEMRWRENTLVSSSVNTGSFSGLSAPLSRSLGRFCQSWLSQIVPRTSIANVRQRLPTSADVLKQSGWNEETDEDEAGWSHRILSAPSVSHFQLNRSDFSGSVLGFKIYPPFSMRWNKVCASHERLLVLFSRVSAAVSIFSVSVVKISTVSSS